MGTNRRDFMTLGGLSAAALALSAAGAAQESGGAVTSTGNANDTGTLAMIIITGKADIPETNRAAFLEIGVRQVTNSRLETGNISYAFYEDAMVPGSFFFFEQWRDQAAIDFHFKQPYCLEFITKAREFATAPPEIKIYPVAAQQTPNG